MSLKRHCRRSLFPPPRAPEFPLPLPQLTPATRRLEKARKTCIRCQARESLRQVTASCTKCGKICSGSLRSSCYECNTVTTLFCFISLMFPRQGKIKYYQIDVPVFIKLIICFPSFFCDFSCVLWF